MGGGASKRTAVAAHVPVPADPTAAEAENLPAATGLEEPDQHSHAASSDPGAMATKVAARISLPEFKDWYLKLLRHEGSDHQVRCRGSSVFIGGLPYGPILCIMFPTSVMRQHYCIDLDVLPSPSTPFCGELLLSEPG